MGVCVASSSCEIGKQINNQLNAIATDDVGEGPAIADLQTNATNERLNWPKAVHEATFRESWG